LQFEVGRLVARIQVDGLQTFGRDLDQVGRQFGALDDRGRQASEHIGRQLTFVGAAILALVGLAITRFAEFDKAMSTAGSVIDGFADKQEELRKAALDAGAVTIYTAREAADAQAELGRAGIAASDILGGALTGSLALAAAGQLEVADAAEITATTLTQFRLSGDKAVHVADLLAAGANKAQGGVSDLSLALKQSGLVASQMGLSVEETVGTLTAFASAGLIGSDAGTSFRTMLLALATPTKQQAELMEQYNIAAYENGKFVGIAALAQQLHTGKLSEATQQQRDYALGVIFGSDAIRAANVLYNQGATGIGEYTDAVNDNGAASRIAGQMQNNLAGDVEKLGGAFDSALIQTGEGANGVLRDMVQWLTTLVDAYGDLPDPVQQGVLAFGLITGAVLLFGGMLLTTIPKIVEFRLAVQTLTTQLPAMGAAARGVAGILTGPWGIAIVAAVLGLELFQKWTDSMKASSEELTASLSTQGRTAESIFATFAKGSGGVLGLYAANIERIQEAINAVDDSNNPFAFFTDTELNNTFNNLREIGDQLGEIAKTDLSSAQESYRQFVATTDGSTESQWRLLNAFDEYKAQIVAVATANGAYSETMTEAEKKAVILAYAYGDTTVATEESTSAYREINGVMVEVTDSLDELIQSLNEANGAQISASDAQIRYLDTLAKVSEAIATNGATLDLNTDAGRRNRELLNDIASSAMKMAETQLEVTGNYEQYRQTLVGARDDLIRNAMDMGASAEEAARIADEILRIPSEAETNVTVRDNASGTLDRILGKMRGIGAGVTAGIYVGGQKDGGVVDYYANGGFSEHHVAQIAAAGSMRVWAEPETGGEAYIPLSSSKRSRSEAILAEVAARFGGSYIPGNSNGGGSDDGEPPAGRSGGGGGANVEIHLHSPVVRDLMSEIREGADYARAALTIPSGS
jgi:TP901 family phage tail tape measure protein